MAARVVFLAAFVCVAAVAAAQVDTVVVVMLENRAFDHIFGMFPGVDGVPAHETNPLNTSDPSSPRVALRTDPPYVLHCDPDHSTFATTAKVFGMAAARADNLTNATMAGFVEWEAHRNNSKTNYCEVLSTYRPREVPTLSWLATEFALFDRYFCSHPGPTWTNRMYGLTGTCAGGTETGPWYNNTDGLLFPQPTILDQLARAGKTVATYHQSSPWELYLASMVHNLDWHRSWSEFSRDAKRGTLPSYSWVVSNCAYDFRTGLGANDMHPNHDLRLGEHFLADVYGMLRASPQWNRTLLLVTWDEHGGFADHVPPPAAPPPEPHMKSNYAGDAQFLFNRLGVRVPLLAISPLIPRGTVVSKPPAAQRPFPDSQYEHSSMMATARKLLGVGGALTARDAWAATFEHIVSLKEPRATPLQAPRPPAPARLRLPDPMAPPNDLQSFLLHLHGNLSVAATGRPPARAARVQDHVHGALEAGFALLQRTRAQQVGRYGVRVFPEGPHPLPPTVRDRSWRLDLYPRRLSTWTLSYLQQHFCLTRRNNSTSLGLELCSQTDPMQEFAFHADWTLRAGNATSTACVTVGPSLDSNPNMHGARDVFLLPCTGAPTQYYTYNGKAPGGTYNGGLEWAVAAFCAIELSST